MTRQVKGMLRMMFIGGLLSPKGWILRAGLLLAIFGILHLLGWRDDTRIISGTSLDGHATIIHGLLYGLAYFAAMLVCPILILAAGLYALLMRFVPSMKSSICTETAPTNIPSSEPQV